MAAGLGIDAQLLPPIRETLEELEALYDRGVCFFVATSADGQVIGSVRGTLVDGSVEIGRLVVDDGWQRRGVASALMDVLESSFSEVERFELFTGAEATVPLALYAKRGYTETRREDLGHVELVWLEKRREDG